jgi:glycerol uptake facilitator-like aquaporin
MPQRLLAEYLGSLVLVVAAISPIILGYHVLGGSLALAVLMDAVAVGFVLFVLIEIFEPISYCHINPAVTLSMMVSRRIEVKTGILYLIVQFLGGLSGTLVSHLMFFHEKFFKLLTVSQVVRSNGAYVGEFVGTFLLVLTIYGCMYKKSVRPGLIIGFLVGGLLITTSSTMFANPQVTFARIFTFAIAGVRPVDGMIFIVVQILGALMATITAAFLFPFPARERKGDDNLSG